MDNFKGLRVGSKASLVFYQCMGVIHNSHWNAMMTSVLQNGRVVIIAEPEDVKHIFAGLDHRHNTLQFDFKYTAVMSFPPSRILEKDRPARTFWDLYFLKVKGGSPHFNDDGELHERHKSRSQFWSHGVFKATTQEECLRSKASTASTPLYPRQPPIELFEFIIEVGLLHSQSICIKSYLGIRTCSSLRNCIE